jgi:N-acetylglucosaminyldiphosphoundecaprenol N-acetyl-beta-D-mannosaminyltransferase
MNAASAAATAAPPKIESREILGVRVDATSYERATEQIIAWASAGLSLPISRYVSLCTVNQIIEARDSTTFAEAMRKADLVTSDGMPIVWSLRRLGVPYASRVYGPDLMPLVLHAAARDGVPVGFYGGSTNVLDRLVRLVRSRFSGLQIAYAEAPPFRPLTPQEEEHTVRTLNASGARILFVGIGSPKQELWMHAHRDRVNCVMIGVGAAFDFLTGAKPQAPRWMQRYGLEWLFRLLSEPARLWRRYLLQNPRFLVLIALHMLRGARFSVPGRDSSRPL